jgi:hypothetical protein
MKKFILSVLITLSLLFGSVVKADELDEIATMACAQWTLAVIDAVGTRYMEGATADQTVAEMHAAFESDTSVKTRKLIEVMIRKAFALQAQIDAGKLDIKDASIQDEHQKVLEACHPEAKALIKKRMEKELM